MKNKEDGVIIFGTTSKDEAKPVYMTPEYAHKLSLLMESQKEHIADVGKTTDEQGDWEEGFSEFTICKPLELEDDKFFIDATPEQLKDFFRSERAICEKETIERIRKMIEGKRKENKETEKWSDDYYHALDDLLNDKELRVESMEEKFTEATKRRYEYVSKDHHWEIKHIRQ